MRRCAMWLLLLALAAPAQAERQARGSLGEATYRQLDRAQTLMAEDQHADALKVLQPLVERAGNDYERAVVLQTLGYLYADQGQYARAIPPFEQALALDALPQQPYEQMLLALGQLLFAEGRMDAAIARFEQYFSEAGSDAGADAHLMLASAYADRKRFRDALPQVDAAIAKASTPKASWYQLKLGLHYELKQFPACAETLVALIALVPDDPQYWRQLSSVLFEIKRDRASLAVLALAARQGFLTQASEIRNLASLYLLLEIPQKAAQVLDDGIARGILASDETTLSRLGEAWIAAREYGRADDVMARAAAMAAGGERALRLAQLRIEDQRWAAALEALDQALLKGVPKPGEAQFLRGVAAFEAGDLQRAEQAFTAAMAHRERRQDARDWLAHLRQRAAETAAAARSPG